MICVRPAILVILVTFATLATSETIVILAMPVIYVTPVNSAILAIIGTSGSQCHPVVRQHGRLPQGSLQVRRDFSRKSLGHSLRHHSRHRQLSLHGALSMVRQASCSR